MKIIKIFLLTIFCPGLIIGQNANLKQEINNAASWKQFMEKGNNLKIASEGLAVPINESNDFSFESKLITFPQSVNAKEITFKQSTVWDNWIPTTANVGPSEASDAPILVSVKEGEYYYLAKGSTGGYHAWESDNMKNWKDRGPVTGNGERTGRWTTSAEYKDGLFYIYYDAPNDQDPHLYIDDNLRDGIIGESKGIAFDDPSDGSDCSVFRDDEDGLFHIIYEDWSPIRARSNSWDSPLAGHTSSIDGYTGFKPHEHPFIIDHRTNPTGTFGTYEHPTSGTLTYEIHQPAQDAYGDFTTIKVGSQYYLFSDYEQVGQSIRTARFTSNSLYQEFDLVGSLGNGHPDPTVAFAEGQFYLITQQKTDFISPGPWVGGVSARVGVDVDGNGTVDEWTNWQEIKESYNHKPGFIRVVNVNDAKIDLSKLPAAYGFKFEFRVDNGLVDGVSPLMDKVELTFTGSSEGNSNIALGKAAEQSTTAHNGIASRAVDGNTNGKFVQNSVTHTQKNGSSNPWWRVDLTETYQVNHISIYNRTDNCCKNRLNGAKIYVGNTKSANPNDYTEIGILNNDLVQNFSGLNKQGRYVMIRIDGGSEILSLAEVEVYGSETTEPANCSNPKNIATGKTATQSSTLPHKVNFAATNAIDGNNNGNHNAGSLTHTKNEQQAWWEIDLETLYDLSSVKIWNRTNCCAERLTNFYVLVSDKPFNSKVLNNTINQNGVSDFHFQGTAGRETDINLNRTGRYVRIQLSGSNALQLAEVEIFGCKKANRIKLNRVNEALSFSPNPAQDYINITLQNYDEPDIEYVICSLQRQIVSTGSLNTNFGKPTSIDVSHLQNGKYLIYLQTESKQIAAKKIIIMKE